MCRKIFGLFCLFILVFSLFSCKDKGDVQGSGNAGADINEQTPVDKTLYLPITEDGKGQINVVSSYSKTADYAAAYKKLMGYFTAKGIDLTVGYEASEDPDTPELLIGGKINAKGDYYIDPHTLGDEGYAIRVVGNKIIIAGGTSESLVKAIELLTSSVLDLDNPVTDVSNLAIARSTNIFERQDYPINSVTVGGADLAGYDIVCNTSIATEKACAEKLRNILYSNAGYWLNVKKESDKPKIRFDTVDYAGEEGFRVYVDGVDLVVECAYPALLPETFDLFLDAFFASDDERDIAFSKGDDPIFTVQIAALSYSDFGAVGDGITDDFAAIKAAHDAANLTGQTVIAESGKTYYLGKHADTIVIKTNTVWTGASFIIDDSSILPTDSPSRYNVFSVESNTYSSPVVGIKSLNKGQTNVGMSFDGPTLLYIVHSGKKQYIRYGANADSGADQQEIILVDKDGNVDPSTPILWDYPTVSSAVAYPAYDKPVTITGGTFLTIANAAPREYTYYARGIRIKRSNVTVDGLTHNITGEGDTGAPYNGFLSISYCTNVLVKNTTLTGHKVYKLSTDSSNLMGTYDISVSNANNVTFLNCRQTNSITDSKYWGIMGSNYCKNLTYDGCVFSRFDAHKGTHNATIRNSEIGHQRLNIIGSGLLTVENTVIHGNYIINLRNDYGSTWDGDVIIRNVTLNNSSENPTLFNGKWNNHYFGYTCHLPKNITIDGITLNKGTFFYVLPALKNGIDEDMINGSENKNKIVLTEKITVVSNPMGYTYAVSSNSVLYSGVVLTED